MKLSEGDNWTPEVVELEATYPTIPEDSMDKIDTILNCLMGNTGDFKRRCEARITSPNIVKELYKAIAEGDKLMGNIETVMDRLFEIKERLEDHDEN